jgi:hypothetical protein
MILERYQIETDDNQEIFKLVSFGENGQILKQINYIHPEDPKFRIYFWVM